MERTMQNVRDADATVIFHHGQLQGGTGATADFCRDAGKPLLILEEPQRSQAEAAEEIAEFVSTNTIAILNVAGPRASQWSAGYDYARETLLLFLRRVAAEVSPRLSFVVPAHNEEHELPATLRAILRAAEAAGEPFEMIVVDDASTDSTAEIARQFGAKAISVNHRQIAAVRNAGARMARGEIFFFVDADTRIAPGHVSAGIAALDAGCSGGSARVAMDVENTFWGRILLRSFSAIYFGVARLGAGAFLFTRRESFEAVGGFDEQYFAGEEVYFSVALKKLGPFKILRQPIVTSARKLRMHSPGSILRQFLLILAGGKRAVRSRAKLALWYDGRRERAQPDERVEHAVVED
jgi:GT2 family glycosyltransferase